MTITTFYGMFLHSQTDPVNNLVTSGVQNGVAATTFGDNGWVSAWNDGSGNIQARIFLDTSTPAGSEFTVSAAAGIQTDPTVATLTSGRAVIAYTDFGGNPQGQVVFREVDTDGTMAPGTTIVMSSPTLKASAPHVAPLLDGGFVVSYSLDYGADDIDVDGVVYNANGSVRSPFNANTSTTLDTGFSSVSDLSNGGFVVAFEESAKGTFSNYSVWFQLYNASGAAVGGNVEVDGTGSINRDVQVLGLKNGGFAVAYTDNQYGTGTDISLAVYDNTGAVVKAPFEVNGTTTGDQMNPSLSALDNGDFLVDWTDSTGGFYNALISPTGTKLQGDLHLSQGTVAGQVVALHDGSLVQVFDSSIADAGGDGSIREVVGGVTRQLTSDNASDVLTGDSLIDYLNGGGGNDLLQGYGGNDLLDGGDGTDTAQYTGFFREYSIVRQTDGTLNIADLRVGSPDGTDTDSAIETFIFVGDGSRSLAQVAEITNFNVFWHHDGTDDWRDWSMGKGAPTSYIVGGAPAEWDLKATGDFNGDGVSDALWVNTTTGEYRSIQYTFLGTMDSVNVLGSLPSSWAPLATGDFNGDGSSDIVLEDQSTGDIRIWMMSNGAVASTVLLAGGTLAPEWRVTGSGDFNADGKYDLILKNTSTGEVREWLLNGGTILQNNVLGSLSSAWGIAAVGDFNHDHTADILWRNTATGDTREWQMSNGALANNVILPAASTDWHYIATGDFDQSGTDDLMLQNVNTGEVREWLLDGAGNLSANIVLGTLPGWNAAVTGATHADYLGFI